MLSGARPVLLVLTMLAAVPLLVPVGVAAGPGSGEGGGFNESCTLAELVCVHASTSFFYDCSFADNETVRCVAELSALYGATSEQRVSGESLWQHRFLFSACRESDNHCVDEVVQVEGDLCAWEALAEGCFGSAFYANHSGDITLAPGECFSLVATATVTAQAAVHSFETAVTPVQTTEVFQSSFAEHVICR